MTSGAARITKLEAALPPEPTEAEREDAARCRAMPTAQLIAEIEAASPAVLARLEELQNMGRAELWATITAEMAEHPPPRWRQ